MITIESDVLRIQIDPMGAQLSSIIISNISWNICGKKIQVTGKALLPLFFQSLES